MHVRGVMESVFCCGGKCYRLLELSFLHRFSKKDRGGGLMYQAIMARRMLFMIESQRFLTVYPSRISRWSCMGCDFFLGFFFSPVFFFFCFLLSGRAFKSRDRLNSCATDILYPNEAQHFETTDDTTCIRRSKSATVAIAARRRGWPA